MSRATCRTLIYWVHNANTGGNHPVDCDVEGGEAPSETKLQGQFDVFGGMTETHDGLGLSHFDTCPDAELFRRRKEHR